MKYFLLLVTLFQFQISSSQAIYTTKKDIADAKEIIFFGYDFSHFKLADPKRLSFSNYKDPVGVKEEPASNIKVYVSAWIGYLLNRMDENYFARKLKTSKVVFDFDYTFQIVKRLNDSNLVSLTRSTIPKDSIQSIVNTYQLKQKEGIGFTIIVECFDKSKERSTAYFTFFDIATKKVLMSDYFGTNHADGIGLTNHWGYGFHYTVNSYIDLEFKSNVKSKK